jgi:hypothetical protein
MKKIASRTRAFALNRTALAAALSMTALGFPAHVVPQTAPVNVSTIWWVPAESGWGLNLNQQGDSVFAAWFTYGEDGKALWLYGVLNQQQGAEVWSGPIFRTTGVPFDQITGAASKTNDSAGTAILTATPDGALLLQQTIGTTTQTKRLERFAFDAAVPVCRTTSDSRAGATNYQDIWFNEAEPGWGINLIHQGKTIFVAWYTYRADGTPQWVSGTTTQSATDAKKFSGALLRTTGTPFANINGSPAVTAAAETVGTLEFSFSDGQTATMRYTLDGKTQEKPIKRFVYANPQTVCEPAPTPPPAKVPVEAAKLNEFLQAGSYKTWGAEAAIHPANSPHPTNVRSYANPILEAAMRAGATNFPVDSATVKELYTADNQLRGWAVSVKTQMGQGANNWYWYEVLSTNPTAAPVANGNGVGGCAGCHSSGVDYVRTRFPFQN